LARAEKLGIINIKNANNIFTNKEHGSDVACLKSQIRKLRIQVFKEVAWGLS